MATAALVSEIQAATTSAKQELLTRFFGSPNDFFTEGDLIACFAHRLHSVFATNKLPPLVHLQYPTPFRCSMKTRVFQAKAPNDTKYRRGFFDLTVLHPAFAAEFANDFRAFKGQTWSLVQTILASRTATSAPAALSVFELMYLRDPVWSDPSVERGAKTAEKIAVEAKLDFDKALHALEPMSTGFQFATQASMLLFDNGLSPGAALELRDMLAPGIEFYSASLGPAVATNGDQRDWAHMDAAPRAKASSLKSNTIPESPGVYAWFLNGSRMYVGTAASLRDRIGKNHLGRGASLKGSALRRNVAEHHGFASAADLKNGSATLTAQQLATVRTWLGSCDVAWLTCQSPGHALALETKLKAEFKPPLTKR